MASSKKHGNIKSGQTSVFQQGYLNRNFNSSSETIVSLPNGSKNRRDLRSSIISLGLAKSTDRITYTWRNINVLTSGSIDASDNKSYQDGIDTEKQVSCFKRSEEKQAKQILNNGIASPGELVAIMGASGAGKSTLLNVLNFRTHGNKLRVSGERAVNGVNVSAESFTSISAYVQQDDLFIGSLTVREHLVFQALVRMHSRISYKVRIERVEEVIDELGLSKCADARIGIPGVVKGISGGERKRLAVASEILTDPPLMFCDEPTSGLDSYMSQNVVSVLKRLANKGKTIISTIHQPSSQTFQMFDKVILMTEGRVAFIGSSEKALKFFKLNGYNCPPIYNPADFFLETLALQRWNEHESASRIAQICNAFEISPEGKEILKFTEEKSADPIAAEYLKNEASMNFKSPYKASWKEQLKAVLWRSWISNLKDPMFIKIKVFQSIVLSLTIGIVFFGQEFNQDGVQNINGGNFNAMMNLSFWNAIGAVHVFSSELPLFLREHFNGMYRTDVYFLAKMIAEFPFFLIFPFCTITIIYFMIGLQLELGAFFITSGVYILIANCAVSIGYLVSCFASSGVVAATIAPALILPLVLVGGLFMNTGSIPTCLIWMKYISWFHYANEAITVVQWRNVDFIQCSRENSTCPSNGHVVLKSLDFNEDHILWDIFALFGLLTVFRILAYLALLRKTNRN